MRKFTLFIASLFLALGAMAQTFVMPETGKYYKIKGDNSQYPWLMGVQKSGGSGVAVSANEADAAIFEKTENGLKVYGTDTFCIIQVPVMLLSVILNLLLLLVIITIPPIMVLNIQ